MNDRELAKIFESIAGARPKIMTLIPYKRELVSPAPRMEVFWTYSELVPQTTVEELAERFFAALSDCELDNTLRILAHLNNFLNAKHSSKRIHDKINSDLLSNERLKEIARQSLREKENPPPARVVFHRFALLLNMKLLLGLKEHGNNVDAALVGEIALLANDFISEQKYESNQDLILEVMPTWEISNPRDIAYSMARYDYLVKDYVLGDDPKITKLRDRFRLDLQTFGGLSLDEYITLIFGLYSLTQESGASLLSADSVGQNLRIAPEAIGTFFSGRSLSAEKFRTTFADGGWTKQDFLTLINDRKFVRDTSEIRRYPFVQLDQNTHLVLDSTCVVELLAGGLYWTIFDSLPERPAKDREYFRDLWGRAFELYCVDLLSHFYGMSDLGLSPLKANVEYRSDAGNGQIDALLDFGNEVVLFEVKASLLSLDAKCSGDWNRLSAELKRNFVENEKGQPKGLRQLARAANALIEGGVVGGQAPKTVFPVLLVDEKAMECLAMNTHLNEIFLAVGEIADGVKPLTVMSVDELEELLPYVHGNQVSWKEILQSRFKANEVAITSVHQALYNINRDRKTAIIRNDLLLNRYEAMFEQMKKLCPP